MGMLTLSVNFLWIKWGNFTCFTSFIVLRATLQQSSKIDDLVVEYCLPMYLCVLCNCLLKFFRHEKNYLDLLLRQYKSQQCSSIAYFLYNSLCCIVM